MAHFAQLDASSIVLQVVVADQSYIDSGSLGNPADWKQTSYNTKGGVYYDAVTNLPSPDQSKAFRKNFACIGFSYDTGRDAFIPPKPYPSWILNEFSCLWEAPVPYPNDGKIYVWDEAIVNWVEVLLDGPPA